MSVGAVLLGGSPENIARGFCSRTSALDSINQFILKAGVAWVPPPYRISVAFLNLRRHSSGRLPERAVKGHPAQQ